MAEMNFLPALIEARGETHYIITRAWGDHGVKAAVKVLSGDTPIASDTVTLTSAKSRDTFTATLPDALHDGAGDALLALAGRVEHALRGDGTDEDAAAGEGDGRPTQSTLLVQLAADLTLFHTPDSEPYALLPVGDHREVWALKVKQTRHLLSHRYYAAYEKAPGAQAMQDALAVLSARAIFDGETHPVHVRLAEHEGRIYLDLADDRWRVVEVGPDGWRVLASTDCPVRFRRPKGMLPLPIPEPGGTLALLRPYVNAADNRTWMFVVAWLVAALRGRGPYWVLAVAGEQGAAKSSLLRALRLLLDPNIAPIRRLPRDGRDLMIGATNSLTQMFDNVSEIPETLADDLCRLATGGGMSTRQLYADDEETLFDAMRPIALNGIVDVVARPDLADRALPTLLERIPEEARRDERTLWNDFEQARPLILGALLDAVATGLRNLSTTRLDKLPRMADAALWIAAAEPALGWEPGAFMAAYTESRALTANIALDDSPLARAVIVFMEERGAWRGSASALLAALNEKRDERERKADGWPKRPNGLAGMLRRIAPNLRTVEIEAWFTERKGTRIIHLEWRGKASAPSAPIGDFPSGAGENRGADGVEMIGTPIGTPPDDRHPGEKNEMAEGADLFTGGADGADSENGHRHPHFPNATGENEGWGADGADHLPLHSHNAPAPPSHTEPTPEDIAWARVHIQSGALSLAATDLARVRRLGGGGFDTRTWRADLCARYGWPAPPPLAAPNDPAPRNDTHDTHDTTAVGVDRVEVYGECVDPLRTWAEAVADGWVTDIPAAVQRAAAHRGLKLDPFAVRRETRRILSILDTPQAADG